MRGEGERGEEGGEERGDEGGEGEGLVFTLPKLAALTG